MKESEYETLMEWEKKLWAQNEKQDETHMFLGDVWKCSGVIAYFYDLCQSNCQEMKFQKGERANWVQIIITNKTPQADAFIVIYVMCIGTTIEPFTGNSHRLQDFLNSRVRFSQSQVQIRILSTKFFIRCLTCTFSVLSDNFIYRWFALSGAILWRLAPSM